MNRPKGGVAKKQKYHVGDMISHRGGLCLVEHLNFAGGQRVSQVFTQRFAWVNVEFVDEVYTKKTHPEYFL